MKDFDTSQYNNCHSLCDFVFRFLNKSNFSPCVVFLNKFELSLVFLFRMASLETRCLMMKYRQGHWVISSKLLYPKGSRSGQTGVPAELMARHRNFILCCFVQNPLLKRKYLQNISKIHPSEIEEILKQVFTMCNAVLATRFDDHIIVPGLCPVLNFVSFSLQIMCSLRLEYLLR